MRYLILGGGGFIGSHLCDSLLLSGHSVRVFERPNLSRYREFNDTELIEWVDGDFTNKMDLACAVQDCDVIYHLVSTTLPKTSNDNSVFDVTSNVVGTLNLLEVAKQAKVSKVVFVSSGGTVYGIPRQIPISEADPTEPVVSYGISKLAIEKYLHLYHVLHGMEYCILRIANLYGERQKVNTAQGAVAVFLYRALRRQPIEIWGDGSVIRDYIYIGDAVSALLKAGEYEGEPRLFNIGSGEGKSLNQVLETIENLIGRSVDRRYLPGRSFDIPANVLNITRARELLDWEPQTTFIEGIHRTLSWFK